VSVGHNGGGKMEGSEGIKSLLSDFFSLEGMRANSLVTRFWLLSNIGGFGGEKRRFL